MLKRLLLFIFIFLFAVSSSHAWLAGYAKRKKITIQGANLDANQTHFPVLVYVVDSDIDDECDDDGDRSFDIRFTQSDDSVLDVDWMDYSEAGGNATIWAFVSDAGWTIESDGSTEIYLYYGNAAAGDPGTDAGVWDANFKTVYHMEDLTTSTIDDSTTNNNDGTKQAANEPIESSTAKIYRSQDFDGSNDDIAIPMVAEIVVGGTYTISAWAYQDVNGAGCVINLSDSEDSHGIVFNWGTLWAGYHDDAVRTQLKTTYTAGNWYYITFVNSSGTVILYVDGASTGTVDTAGNLATWELFLGNNSNGGILNGKIDEVRISGSVRSADWVKFEYYNMSEADNELTWGGEQSPPADDYIPKVIFIKGTI